ncbi:hypothetical protein E6H36_05415 [Candidatus Bathyarchaeota archaeon]|nr:MAG: hypothetical protein E6H36_05415 [Candidatus Bathyarchaeota archaeon]TMI31601.1 MAG: hypothetical protein E6H29_05195 [Candidatus Bathyarchaeota archaeon]
MGTWKTVTVTTVTTLARDMRQCTSACPKHGVQCRLKMFEQEAYPMHAHLVDGKMCVWAK